MNKPAGKLRLGPLPRSEAVKLTVTMSTDLKAALDGYAALHSQQHGKKVDSTALIPHMLAAFMERDRGFKSMTAKIGAPRLPQ